MGHLRRWLPTVAAEAEDPVTEEMAFSYAMSWLGRLKKDLAFTSHVPSQKERYPLLVRVTCHLLLLYLRNWNDVVSVARSSSEVDRAQDSKRIAPCQALSDL